MNRSTLVAFPILILLVVFQSSVLTVLPLIEVVVQPVMLAAVAWGMLRGLIDGLIWGFIGGFLLDLFSVGPWGSHSLALMITAAFAVWVVSTLPMNRFWLPGVLGGLCAVINLIILGAMVQVSPFGNHWPSMPNLTAYFVVQGTAMILIYWSLFLLRQFLYPPEVTGTGF